MRRHVGLRFALLLFAACNSASSSAPKPAAEKKPLRPLAAGESNIARADYIGPNACGECHAPQFAAWTLSLHRVMNAKADDPGAVIGDFKGAVLSYAGGEARFARDLAGLTMTVTKGERQARYRVTRTIGKHALQEYVGVEDGVGRERGDEVRLPFGWWPRYGGWAPQPAFDPWLDETAFDAYAPVREPWAERCPWCHSTYPFEQRISRATAARLR